SECGPDGPSRVISAAPSLPSSSPPYDGGARRKVTAPSQNLTGSRHHGNHAGSAIAASRDAELWSSAMLFGHVVVLSTSKAPPRGSSARCATKRHTSERARSPGSARSTTGKNRNRDCH